MHGFVHMLLCDYLCRNGNEGIKNLLQATGDMFHTLLHVDACGLLNSQIAPNCSAITLFALAVGLPVHSLVTMQNRDL